MDKKRHFLKIFRKAEKKYGKSVKRLAAEGWDKPWKMLLVTICSAQNRDEVTIPVMEAFFKKFNTLEKIAGAHVEAIKKYIRAINYCESKAKYLKETARMLLDKYGGKVPDDMEKLTEFPGVGRKTANLVLSVVHGKDGITVDTHVHRISNVFGFVKTKSRDKTEEELKKIAPKKYWSKINRLFVLWGKQVPGRDKKRLLAKLEEKG
jgi:endonuclease-3